jgi:hypothetical protein
MQRPGQLQVPLRRGKLQGSFSTAVSI